MVLLSRFPPFSLPNLESAVLSHHGATPLPVQEAQLLFSLLWVTQHHREASAYMRREVPLPYNYCSPVGT